MIAKLLVIHDSVHNTLEAIDPARATGIPIPTAIVVNHLPRTGQVAGEVYMVKPTKTAYVFDGKDFIPIVPSAILSYPTDADVYADKAPGAGSYAVSQDTGNLFVKTKGPEWHQVGIRIYADSANMDADPNALEGDIAYCYDTQTHYSYDGAAWQRLQGPIINVSLTAPAGAVSGDLWYDQTKRQLMVSDGTKWLNAYDGLTRTGDGHLRVDSANTASLEFINAGAAKNFGLDSRDQTGPRFWVSNAGTINNFLEVKPSGEMYFPTGFQDPNHIRDEITLGANAATAQEIILIKGMPAKNGSVYIDLTDEDTGQERSNFALHVFCEDAGGDAPIMAMHIFAANPKIDYFRFYWKDSTDNYVLAVKVKAGSNGVKYRASVRSVTYPMPAVKFDGNTVSTSTDGNIVMANNSHHGGPRLAAYKTISPHDFGADLWEYTEYHIKVEDFVPIGHLYRIDVAISFSQYHGGKIYLMAKIHDGMTGGHPDAGWSRIEPVADFQTSSFIQTSKAGIVAAGELLLKVGTFGTAGSPNNDRQGFGTILLYDLGPTAGVPVIP